LSANTLGDPSVQITVSYDGSEIPGGATFSASATGGPAGSVQNAVLTPAIQIAEYLIPSGLQCPNDITGGPDGRVWFTEPCGSELVGVINPAGSITEYAASNPFGIAAGPDGKLWFTDNGDALIGSMTRSGAQTI